MSWAAILILAAGSYGFKLAGVVGGTRVTHPTLVRAVGLLPPALFGAVIALQTFERSQSLTIDARAIGLVVALVAVWRRLPFIAVIVAAMIATAAARLVL